MTKRSEFLGMLVGDWHTEHYVAGVIDDLDEAEQARSALEQAGWKADEVRLFRGKPAVQKIEQIEAERSLPERLAATVRGATSDEGPISEVYETEAEQGHQILAVYAHDPAEVERARRILAAHQAHALEYFGSWVITDLPAQEDTRPGV
ncbi:MAG TPA: hypothetical protein VKT82_01965 [Ktedonobacterales bacterium]|nr:hypothetical protein [Ktedonobacterales bacterium]